MPRPNKLTIEFVKNKIKEGWTDEKIGDVFKITRQSVYQFRKKNGLSQVFNRLKGRNDLMRSAYKAGNAIVDVARKFGKSLSQTYKIVKNN